jgi:putative methionine-R-sulfoxide reductase with GAF domain
MSDERIDRLRSVSGSQLPRTERARRAAETIADGKYRWVAIYEVDDDKVSVLGEFGTASRPSNAALAAGALATAAFATIDGVAIVPILGAESAVAIGALAVERDRSATYDEEERGALERYAAIVIALFE